MREIDIPRHVDAPELYPRELPEDTELHVTQVNQHSGSEGSIEPLIYDSTLLYPPFHIIPSHNLVEFCTTNGWLNRDPLLAARDRKMLLIEAFKLRTLIYRGPVLPILDGERMPPLRELMLEDYPWPRSFTGFQEQWDFTQLTSLYIKNINVSFRG